MKYSMLPPFPRHQDVRELLKKETGLFFMTGSQNFALMSAVADRQTSKVAVIPFLGLSGNEWEKAPYKLVPGVTTMSGSKT